MPAEFSDYRRNLPHWRLEGHLYFVTWRLDKKQEPLSFQERSVVFDAVRFFDRDRFILHALVVMDDHVHVMVCPQRGYKLEAIVHTWKSFTTNRLQKTHGRHGSVWQREYFDRIIRDDDEYSEKANYMMNNPVMRWPDVIEYEWSWIGPGN